MIFFRHKKENDSRAIRNYKVKWDEIKRVEERLEIKWDKITTQDTPIHSDLESGCSDNHKNSDGIELQKWNK